MSIHRVKKFSNNLTNLNVLNRTVKLKALEDDEECLEIEKKLTVRSNLEVTCENPITKMMKTVKKRARSWVSILSRNHKGFEFRKVKKKCSKKHSKK